MVEILVKHLETHREYRLELNREDTVQDLYNKLTGNYPELREKPFGLYSNGVALRKMWTIGYLIDGGYWGPGKALELSVQALADNKATRADQPLDLSSLSDLAQQTNRGAAPAIRDVVEVNEPSEGDDSMEVGPSSRDTLPDFYVEKLSEDDEEDSGQTTDIEIATESLQSAVEEMEKREVDGEVEEVSGMSLGDEVDFDDDVAQPEPLSRTPSIKGDKAHEGRGSEELEQLTRASCGDDEGSDEDTTVESENTVIEDETGEIGSPRDGNLDDQLGTSSSDDGVLASSVVGKIQDADFDSVLGEEPETPSLDDTIDDFSSEPLVSHGGEDDEIRVIEGPLDVESNLEAGQTSSPDAPTEIDLPSTEEIQVESQELAQSYSEADDDDLPATPSSMASKAQAEDFSDMATEFIDPSEIQKEMAAFSPPRSSLDSGSTEEEAVPPAAPPPPPAAASSIPLEDSQEPVLEEKSEGVAGEVPLDEIEEEVEFSADEDEDDEGDGFQAMDIDDDGFGGKSDDLDEALSGLATAGGGGGLGAGGGRGGAPPMGGGRSPGGSVSEVDGDMIFGGRPPAESEVREETVETEVDEPSAPAASTPVRKEEATEEITEEESEEEDTEEAVGGDGEKGGSSSAKSGAVDRSIAPPAPARRARRSAGPSAAGAVDRLASSMEKEEEPAPQEETEEKAEEREVAPPAQPVVAMKPSVAEEEPAEREVEEKSKKSSDEKKKKNKEEADDVVPEGKLLHRKTTVRHYSQMHPFENFPLMVIISKHEIEKIKVDGVKQATAKKAFAVKMVKPIVQIVPHFPGCLVSPNKMEVNVTPETVEARMWVTPLCEGDLKDARVEVWYDGERVNSVKTPCRVTTHTMTRVMAGLSLLAPFISSTLQAFQMDPESQIRDGFPLVKGLFQMMNTSYTTFVLLFIFLGLTFFFYQRSRAEEADPITEIFEVKTRAPQEEGGEEV